MNRNTQAHFANLPAASIGRSKFNRSFTHKTSFTTGDLVPVYVDMDIIPGDTVSMDQAEIVRMLTPTAPVMDNAYLDFYWFFIPNRLVWNDFKKFMGENETAPWTQTPNVEIPQIKIQTNSKNATTNKVVSTTLLGSVLEKMGIPPTEDWSYATEGSANFKQIKISALPARAYCLIWNEFFRDENLQNPVNISKGSSDQTIINKYYGSYIEDPDQATVSFEERGGLPPLKVCKMHDYFTSCLPGAQKGPAVSLPLSNNPADSFVKFKNYSGNISDTDGERIWLEFDYNSSTEKSTVVGVGDYNHETGNRQLITEDFYTNLYVDLQNATGATVNQLRQAFAIQKFYERDARGGTRYIESVWSHFGVRNPDYRLQRPEYLGGFRQQINVNQVVQNSSTDETSPLGYTGAYSVTTRSDGHVFTHSFTEHGILMGLCCVRTDHTYTQGINRAWFKKKRLDFYSPEFANLSEQAVLNREIYVQGTSEDEEAFGYQECWAEMRYMPDMCTGLMRVSDEAGNATLGSAWTYADEYAEKPRLGDKWIKEPYTNLRRTLAVQDQDDFFGDFYFGAVYTRPMPLYSIPGLIDHH